MLAQTVNAQRFIEIVPDSDNLHKLLLLLANLTQSSLTDLLTNITATCSYSTKQLWARHPPLQCDYANRFCPHNMDNTQHTQAHHFGSSPCACHNKKSIPVQSTETER